jgi:hypothetical protein
MLITDIYHPAIAFTGKMMAVDNGLLLQRVFKDEDFVAAGQLMIPPGGKKPSEGTKDNTYVGLFFLFLFCNSAEVRNRQ